MDIHEKVELATAQTNGYAIADVAIAGVAAVCNELARLGALDAAAIERIRTFMLQTAAQSVGTAKLSGHMQDRIEFHLGDLGHRAAQSPAAPKADQ